MSGHYDRTPWVPRDELDDVMLELRRRGVTYPDIAQAIDVFRGFRLTESQVRYRCRVLGAQPRSRGCAT